MRAVLVAVLVFLPALQTLVEGEPMKYALVAAMLFVFTSAYANDKRLPTKMTDAELDQVVAGVTPATPGLGVVTATSAGGATVNAASGLAKALAQSGMPVGAGTATR
jgi:hypothetical protein